MQESSNKWKSRLPYTLNDVYPSHLLSSADQPHKSSAEFVVFKSGDTTAGNEVRVKKYGELPNFILTTCPNVLNFNKKSIIDGVKRILVFGDQFSDEENLLSKLPETAKKNYYRNMLSDGEIWSSHLRHDLIEHHIKLSNYSFGYATACLQKDGERGLMDLSSEESFFELNKMLKLWKKKELQHDLAIIWIGQNDYFREVKKHHKIKQQKSTSAESGEDLERLHNTEIVEEVIASIERTIDELIKNGIKKIVVINLPDLSLLPISQDLNSKDILQKLSQQHNKQLKQLIDKLSVEDNNDKLKLIDIQPFFTQLTTKIDEFNKKYGTNITKKTESCWNPKINNKHNLQDMFKDVEDKVLTYFIQKILNFWKIGANLIAIDGTMCDKPEEYAFLDRVNFTKEVHQALYRYISEELGITIERQQPAPQESKGRVTSNT